ncbi:MAG TPA: two-component regulator propeller domain-containing protein [Terriglobales bacterium]|nr:two-component regulator propeller domain-containing protein [Terriglobales bacterium]
MRPAPGAILHTVHGKLAGAMLAGLLIARTCAFALNPALDVSQYAHTAWKIRDGFAKGSILSIAQTPDGYLWLGTAFGLYRFDGVRSVLWQPPPDQQFPSNTITNLVVARDGTLWIGTWSGLASWKNGRLTQYAELAGSAIFALVEDRVGSIWAGAKGPDGKLCEIRNGSVRCGSEMSGVDRGVFGLHKDSKGNLWIGLETGVWRWRPGPPAFYAVPGLPNGRMQGMADSEDGTVLIAATGAVMRLADGRAKAVYRFPNARRGFRVLRMLRDRHGGLWVAPAGRGIVHIHQGRTDVFSESEGLSGDDIYDLFEDREGNIWVATINGLDRFHELPVATYSKKQGLSAIPWGGLLAARDGSIWFATLDGLNRLSHSQVTVYRQHTTTPSKQKAVGNGLPDEGVGSLFQDSRGRIWVSTPLGVGYLENNRFVPTSVPGGLVGSLTGDASGSLWIANRELGLLRLSQHHVFPPIPWSTFGRKDPALVLAPDPLHGGLWLGFSRGGVVWFRDGQVRSSYSAADGLGRGAVNELRFDTEGGLWIAAEGGLSQLKNGRIATLTSMSGLPCDAVQWTMEDDAQWVWIMMPCGLVQVARSELDAWTGAADKTARTIHATVFNNSDGLRTLAVVGDYTPRVAKSGDGKLWFMSPDGISVVDPHHLPFNKLLPPVHIEKVIANRKEYQESLLGDALSSPRLPPLLRELEIDYTALSLVAPEKIRFREKLEGWDHDWQDAGTRRQAFYGNLPPRNYRFRVMASNNSGVWNEAGTFLDFSIAPAYYQTWWFRTLCMAAFLSLLWGLYQFRLRQLARQFNIRLEERVNERTRIARDLHDTMLQTFQGLLLKFHGLSIMLTGRPEAQQKLEGLLEQGQQAINEGREAVLGLRSSTVIANDLARAFITLAEELAATQDSHNPVAFQVEVEGETRDLHPILRDEVYRIACEALRNAFQHSGAARIEVAIHYDDREFWVCIRDNGKGIDPKVLDAGERDGHYGLPGMHERAKLAGGRLVVRGRVNSGTEAEITIPAALAYAKSRSPRRSAFLRRGAS